MKNSKQRFTSRVSNYLKARPGYPLEIVHILQRNYALTSKAIIGDIGSGTGLLSELFLKNGNPVYGVEPNQVMREAGERYLDAYPNFSSINGCAETTTLPPESCNWVIAGQAFHWFNAELAQQEFKRILKPSGWVALIWNVIPPTDDTGFCAAYERMFQLYGVDYQGGNYRQSEAAKVLPFFERNSKGSPNGQITQFRLPNPYQLTEADFLSRVLSSSQTPEPGEPTYQKLQDTITELFQQYKTGNFITIPYETLVYIGQL